MQHTLGRLENRLLDKFLPQILGFKKGNRPKCVLETKTNKKQPPKRENRREGKRL